MYMDEEYQDQQRRLAEANYKDRGCLRGLAIAALVVMMFGLILILMAG